MRIGIVDQTSLNWSAGSSYTKMLLSSLSRACVNAGNVPLYLFTRSNNTNVGNGIPVNYVTIGMPEYLPIEKQLRKFLRLGGKEHPLRGEVRLKHILGMNDGSDVFLSARNLDISVLLPLFDVPDWDIGVKTIGWIPDFQHKHLPQFFSEENIRIRDNSIKRLAERSQIILLSSVDALKDLSRFFPEYAHKGKALPFPSLFAFDRPHGDPRSVIDRFKLPPKFILVANQFWQHKNHIVVVEAIKILKEQGMDAPVVMTGLPADHRDPQNKTLSHLLQAIASSGLQEKITLLGQVDFEHLVSLMRVAALIIQPSRFEGWSTIVQDAKAIGRPIVCSDLTVLREQAPEAIGFFMWDRPEQLASIIAEYWQTLSPGPNPDDERSALDRENEFAGVHGNSMIELCKVAAGIKF